MILLHEDPWDDWFTYQTLYQVEIIDDKGRHHHIGGTKVGKIGLKSGRPDLPNKFERLGEDFFSLGQDIDYYAQIREFGSDDDSPMALLQDIALNTHLWESVKTENVTTTSLLRYLSEKKVEKIFHRVATGGAILTPYKFVYSSYITKSEEVEYSLSVVVRPEASPPMNVHAVIGRNGVGKTRMLNGMASALQCRNYKRKGIGGFDFEYYGEGSRFANMVFVSFSAFDTTTKIESEPDATTPYSYIGLRRYSAKDRNTIVTKSISSLASDLVEGIKLCGKKSRISNLLDAIRVLDQDPLFKEIDVAENLQLLNSGSTFKEARAGLVDFFKKLSSGHAIVLLTIVRLVAVVEEATLVLIDEPEAHLHPPLLSAFVRALSNLMINRNAVALIATHSPVILQEIPRSCASIMFRSGRSCKIEKPPQETFGENLSVLSREVFAYDVVASGFHTMLQEAARVFKTYDEALTYFEGKLGGEAKMILRAMIENKDYEDQ